MPATVNDLRVLVVAGDPLARAGLATLLADQPGCTVVGQVTAEAAGSTTLEVYRPDVVAWDLGWEPTLALEALVELPESSPPVVALVPDDTYAMRPGLPGRGAFYSGMQMLPVCGRP